MKFRCKNCFKVLNKNEEYCTSCGEHSEEVAAYMAESKHELDSIAKLKLSLIMYLAIAFLGTGVLMITFAVIQNKNSSTYDMNACKGISFLISSIVLFIVMIAVNFKELKLMLFNGTTKQLGAALLVGILVMGIIGVLHYLSVNTRVIPNYMVDFLNGTIIFEVDGNWMSSTTLLISLLFSIVVEEIVFRKRLIDALDDETLLGDTAIVIISAIIATILDFMWLMSTETIITMFILNMAMNGIYMNTNRSIGINIILRVILICIIFIL